ncbi:MAG: transcription elongation factor GreA [bacterium]|nr:transcription elongation factor GreA [bacterium]
MLKKYLTQEGLEKLKKELEHLKNVARKEVATKLKEAISQGDLKENAGYDSAKDEQGFIEGRIRELKGIIANAEVVEKRESNKVQICSCVSLSSNSGEDKFQIVSSEEADILENKISFQSPLGEALLNKKKGDTVKITTPGGKTEYKIINIE